LLNKYTCHTFNRYRTKKWPLQHQPDPKHFSIWKNTIIQITNSTPQGKLNTQLGAWYQSQLSRHNRLYLIHKDEDEIAVKIH
jgi:hypothetical protein